MTECLLVPMELLWTKKATSSLRTRAMTASKSSPLPVSLSPNSGWRARIPVNLIDPVEFASLLTEPLLLWILETTECKYSKNTLVLNRCNLKKQDWYEKKRATSTLVLKSGDKYYSQNQKKSTTIKSLSFSEKKISRNFLENTVKKS